MPGILLRRCAADAIASCLGEPLANTRRVFVSMRAQPVASVMSPLTGKPARHVRELPRGKIEEALHEYFQEPPPKGAVEVDYSLWRCEQTGFEFAWPPRAGSEVFYQWIGKFPFYYPGVRWEYRVTAERLREAAAGGSAAFKLLDVGCGSGTFLASLDFLPMQNRHAVDFSPLAIRECRTKGLPSYCGSIEAAVGAGFLASGSLDAVTSFHCLEHVEQPVEFVGQMLALLKPGGTLWVSTPNSPMSFEADWFDVMNHPPHHLGRWNPAAYHALAARVGCRCELFSPPASPLRMTFQEFKLLRYGPHRRVSRIQLVFDLAANIARFSSLWRHQADRLRRLGNVSGDVILVRLTK